MNFTKFKESLKFKKYQTWKIVIRYIEYKIKNFLIDIIIYFNKFKFNSKKVIDIGSYNDNSYINYLIYSLKDEYHFAYEKNKDTKKLFRRIGIINFFKHTICNLNLKKESLIKINMKSEQEDLSKISIDTNYFNFLYKKNTTKNNDELIMPYFMYPRIYNSFYKKINIIQKPNFNLRVFFSGSVVVDGYSSFKWEKDPEKFPNRILIINKILKEFKDKIFLINSKHDLKKNEFLNKRIIFCLHDKMIKKTSYKLNFKNMHLEMTSSGKWFITDKIRTELLADIKSDNFGLALKTLGYPDTIKGGKLQAELSGAWEGSIQDFGFSKTIGTLKFNIERDK